MSSQVLILWLVTLIFSVIMGSVNAFIFFKEHDGVVIVSKLVNCI
jgi:hypothetical protein